MQRSSKRGHGRNDKRLACGAEEPTKPKSNPKLPSTWCNRVDGLEWIRNETRGPQEEGKWDKQT